MLWTPTTPYFAIAAFERDGVGITAYAPPAAETLEQLAAALEVGGIATCPITGAPVYMRAERVTLLRWIGSLTDEQEVAVATDARVLLLQPSDDGAQVFARSAF